MALDYTKLPNDPEELKQLLLKHAGWVEALREEVIRLRRWRFGRSSEVIDVSVAPELPLSGGLTPPPTPMPQTTSELPRPPKLTAVDAPRAPRENKRTRRPPRSLPPELPRVIREHVSSNCNCPDCGQRLSRLGEDASEQLDYVPGYFQVIRHVRPKLACRACARIVQAAAPPRPIERALPTPGLLAQVIAAKYADHCPLYRQEGIYRRSGVELPRAMLASWIGETADLLDPLVGLLERYVLSAEKLHADDTPVPVLAPGKGRTQTGRLWAYVRDDRPSSGPDPPAVVYRYSPDRKAERPQAHLRSFAGILQADAYSGFAPLYAEGRIVEAACWAHARRKYYDVYVMDRSPTAHEALERIGELDIQGYLVQKLSGKPFPEFLKERIFDPLGMKDTAFYVPKEKWTRLATLYKRTDEGQLEDADPDSRTRLEKAPALPSGGGGLVSTAGDYLTFAQMLLNGGQLGGARILGPETVKMMSTNQLPETMIASDWTESDSLLPRGYGFGFDVAVFANPALVERPCGSGTYFWAGATGVWFWIDPTDDVVSVGMVQRSNTPAKVQFGELPQQMTYQALIDLKK